MTHVAQLQTDDRAPVTLAPMVFSEENGTVGAGSTKIGWTRRNRNNDILAGFAYRINPQGITRGFVARNQVFATQGGFYVDQFGPGPADISVRQLVASGKDDGGGYFYTAREDIQRFLKDIWEPATAVGSTDRVYFHDNHFERGHDERVFFPQSALTLLRSVDQHGVWLVEIRMTGLERYPLSDVSASPAQAPVTKIIKHRVTHGETLDKIVAKVAGRYATAAQRKAMLARILTLNPELRHTRQMKIDGHTRTLKPHRVYTGEVIRIPAR